MHFITLACGVNQTPAPLLNRKQAADILGVSLRTIDTLIANGTLRVVRLGASVRIRPEAIVDLLNASETKGGTK